MLVTLTVTTTGLNPASTRHAFVGTIDDEPRVGGRHPERCSTAELQARAAELYEQGLSMAEVGVRLGLTSSTISKALHVARIPVRGNAVAHRDRSGRLLVDDLYADREVLNALLEYGVHVPQEWSEAGPFTVYAPLPLPAGLLDRLYSDIGLSAQHIALLCGVGVGAVSSQLARHGIARRPAHTPSPWNQRRRGRSVDE
ncbi:MAG: hypothetical protein WBP26_00005 [Candidatus Saccharimonadales bacterium]